MVLEGTTAVAEADPSVDQLTLPTALNGDRLRLDGTLPGGYLIMDAMGRVVLSGNTNALAAGVALSDRDRGVYTIWT